MRFATRILVGAGAAALLVMGAPVTASAATAAPSTPVQVSAVTAAPYSFDTWGSYFSGDKKAKAEGKVVVEKKSHKKWYWKKYSKLVKKCTWHNGQKKCKWVKKWYKKHAWKWVHEYHYTVDSKLTNYKWWSKPKHHCAWETFRIVGFDGSTHFESFKNCAKQPAFHSFGGENAQHIHVKVSRGDQGHPNGYQGGWKHVYSHS